jgi:hypothetical protein
MAHSKTANGGQQKSVVRKTRLKELKAQTLRTQAAASGISINELTARRGLEYPGLVASCRAGFNNSLSKISPAGRSSSYDYGRWW